MNIRSKLQIARAMFEAYIEVVNSAHGTNIGVTWETLTESERAGWVAAFERSQKELVLL